MSSMLYDAAFWAKLNDDGRWHPLVAHSADVAAVAARLLEPDSRLNARLSALAGPEGLQPPLAAFVTFLAGLHDIGKANHGFQERAPGRNRRRPEGHVQVVLESLAFQPFVEAISGILNPVISIESANPLDLLATTVAHHGRPFDPQALASRSREGLGELWTASLGGRQPLDEVRRIGLLAADWSGLSRMARLDSLPDDPRFSHLLAGLITLADWIGSTEEAFAPSPAADDDPAAYWEVATERADRACRAIGVVASRPVARLGSGDLYAHLFPTVFGSGQPNTPTQLQAHAAATPLPRPGSRILIEAATGSGKTEAALVLYARLRAEGRVGGLFFALPTRATARAMTDRVADALHGMYDEEAPGITLAIGGEAPELRAANHALAAESNRHDDQEGEAPFGLANWSSSHAKKFLAAEVVVGTVDQVLLAALAVKHAHLRLAGATRLLLVVDEVHSHDLYMLTVLRQLLEFHSAAGGTAVLMSATLSAQARGLLGSGSDESTAQEAVDRAYPTMAVFEPGGDWRDTAVDGNAACREVSWMTSSEADGFKFAIEAARAGARVCLLRNTVKDAQRSVLDLATLGGGGLLWSPPGSSLTPPYHARYAPADRKHLDESILASFGKGARSTDGSILIATQVVEQSLDLDFDLLVTDLAPIEVLIQRIGRLHRHRGRDPLRPISFAQPRAIILVPPAGFKPQRKYRGSHGWGTVYQHQPALELTRRLVVDRATIRLPDQSRELIEAVYHLENLERLREEDGWDVVLDEVEGRGMGQELLARDATLDFDLTYPCNATRFRDELRIRTRLGDDSVRVRLDPPAPCWFALKEVASFVDVRVNDLAGSEIDLRDPVLRDGADVGGGVWEYRLGAKRLRYEPYGWEIDK
ncbi:MAG: CRISPR-associated helicase Cas3' [Gemmatimonadota bacterium]